MAWLAVVIASLWATSMVMEKLILRKLRNCPAHCRCFRIFGTGSFTSTSLAPRADFATGYNAWGVAVGDLDGDGRPDVVFCNAYDSTIQIYQNETPVLTQLPTPPIITITAFTPQSGTNGMVVTLPRNQFQRDNLGEHRIFRRGAGQCFDGEPNSSASNGASGRYIHSDRREANGLTAYADQPFMPTFVGSGPVSFTLSSSPGVGNFPFMATEADVNGDGQVDY